MLTQHDISMNRYVISMRRAKVRHAISSMRHYREAGDKRGQLEAALHFRGVLADYLATVKAIRR